MNRETNDKEKTTTRQYPKINTSQTKPTFLFEDIRLKINRIQSAIYRKFIAISKNIFRNTAHIY